MNALAKWCRRWTSCNWRTDETGFTADVRWLCALQRREEVRACEKWSPGELPNAQYRSLPVMPLDGEPLRGAG
jgi:hypothetical protein